MPAHADRLSTAAPVLHELLYGALRLRISPRRHRLEEHIRRVVVGGLPVLDYSSDAAVWHAHERARLVGIGQTPPFLDSQIAAIAVANGLILATLNPRDFQVFSDLQVEDWSR